MDRDSGINLMDPIQNPFSPGAGSPPPELVGREGILDQARVLLGRVNVKINILGPVRASLIKKGMIYSPAHGDMAFTVPLFDQFMLRAVPKL